MKLYYLSLSANTGNNALFTLVLISCIAGLTGSAAHAQDSDRYGPWGLLDHRSRYGQYWFPEPLRADETDVDNEIRLDWVHQERTGRQFDYVKSEVEKSFGLLTLELEAPYTRESVAERTRLRAIARARAEGIGNVSIGARHPIFQTVSNDGAIDNTVGLALEIGVPTHSTVSKNTEIVPKVFDDLRLGDHFSVQFIAGNSVLLGSAPLGGVQTFEYAAVLGYALERDEIRLRGIERFIPILEFQGETTLTHAEAGRDALSGTVGARINLDSIGPLQPRLGLGYVFPIDQGSRQDFRWGVVSSLVFEF